MAAYCVGPALRGVAARRRASRGWPALLAALAVSTLLHAWLIAALPATRVAGAGAPPAQVLRAVLEALPESAAPDLHGAAAVHPRIAEPEPAPPVAVVPPPPRSRVREPGKSVASIAAAAPERRATAEALLPAPPVEATWYPAQELDTYPRAAIAVDLAGVVQGGADATARLLLWLRIDESGQVVDVRAEDAATPAPLVDAARAALTALRFEPARKDGRAVKSRVLLSIAVARSNSGTPAAR